MHLKGLEVAEGSRGCLVQGDPGVEVKGFSIDSRVIEPGEWFVPLKGERTDGHEYVREALMKGAAGSFYARHLPGDLPPDKTIVKVDDTLLALQDLAGFYRRRFDLDVIGITGSSGKTTTKDIIASVLGRNYQLLKSEGNLNNHIGLPLTLLRLSSRCRIAVLEMGMRGPGEITRLAEIAAPRWGVITNIGVAHLELLGSMDNIARAKGELLESIGTDGTAVLNGDDPYLRKMGDRFKGKVYYYGWQRSADFQALDMTSQGQGAAFSVKFPGSGTENFYLPVPGRHNVTNSLAALALGFLFGMDCSSMREGLINVRLTGGRLAVKESAAGIKIIDDSYNANPDSMKASLSVLQEMAPAGKRAAVLGDMLELGPISEEAHRQVGRDAARYGINYLVAVGSLAAYMAEEAQSAGVASFYCSNNDEAWEQLKELPLGEGWCVLVKGSRSMNLEEIVQKLSG